MRSIRPILTAAGILACGVAGWAAAGDTAQAGARDSLPPVTSVAAAAVDPLHHLGRQVKFTGTVREIIATGIPLKVLLTTGDHKWLASFFAPGDLPEGLFKSGNRVTVSGVLFSLSDVMYQGATLKLMDVMARAAEKVRWGKGKPPVAAPRQTAPDTTRPSDTAASR